MKIMVGFETGSHVGERGVDLFPIRAFRLEPLEQADKGHVTVDGETVRFGAVQARVEPRAACFLVKK